MKRRTALGIVCGMCLWLGMGMVAKAAGGAALRPNVVFILADDLGYGDVGCFGQKMIKTPNIDRMAAEGVRFTNSYCGTSVCAPSRSSLMTGQHIGHCPIRANKEYQPEGQEPLPAGTFTVAQLFKSAGYKTGAFGKWGMGFLDTSGAPDKMGFDYFFGYNCQRQAHNYYQDHLWRNRERVELDGKTYTHDVIFAEALKWVRANAQSPFFLFLPVTIPHAQYQVPDMGPYEKEEWPEQMKKYAAMIARLDGDVGKLLALLKELKIDDNTLVIFTSDNGAANQAAVKLFNSGGPFRDIKRSMYEGGLRAPTVARWPGKVKAGTTNETQWAFYDFLATAAELTGAAIPAGVKTDGVSIAPALVRGETVKREFLYWELHEGGAFRQAVRMGDWKGIRNGLGQAIELYDLSKDVAEKNDLAAEKPEVAKQIAGIMAREHVESAIWPDIKKKVNAGAAKKQNAGK